MSTPHNDHHVQQHAPQQNPQATHSQAQPHAKNKGGTQEEKPSALNAVKNIGVIVAFLALFFAGTKAWEFYSQNKTELDVGDCVTEIDRAGWGDSAKDYKTDCDSPDAHYTVLTATVEEEATECRDVTGAVNSLRSTTVHNNKNSKTSEYCLGNLEMQPEDKVNTLGKGDCLAFTTKGDDEVAAPADCGDRNAQEVVAVVDDKKPESAGLMIIPGAPHEEDPFCKDNGAPEATGYYFLSFGFTESGEITRTLCVK